MFCRYVLALLPLLLARDLEATQDERTLKRAFEGTTVTVRMDMPGTEDGVDVYPGAGTPLDYARYAQRLKTYGVAIRTGESVMVTKVKVKDDLIEFQLGGGGFGTMGDDDRTTVTAPSVPKSNREKDLEKGSRGLGAAAGKRAPAAGRRREPVQPEIPGRCARVGGGAGGDPGRAGEVRRLPRVRRGRGKPAACRVGARLRNATGVAAVGSGSDARPGNHRRGKDGRHAARLGQDVRAAGGTHHRRAG